MNRPLRIALSTVTIAAASVGADDVIASAVEFPPEAAQPDMLTAPEETATAALAESEGEAEAVESCLECCGESSFCRDV